MTELFKVPIKVRVISFSTVETFLLGRLPEHLEHE